MLVVSASDEVLRCGDVAVGECACGGDGRAGDERGRLGAGHRYYGFMFLGRRGVPHARVGRGGASDSLRASWCVRAVRLALGAGVAGRRCSSSSLIVTVTVRLGPGCALRVRSPVSRRVRVHASMYIDRILYSSWECIAVAVLSCVKL